MADVEKEEKEYGTTACRECESWESLWEGFSIRTGCNHPDCYKPGKFDPITGQRENKRERKHSDDSMNGLGACSLFKEKKPISKKKVDKWYRRIFNDSGD